MKLIIAVVKRGRLEDVMRAVTGAGAHGLTATEVMGFGQEYSHVAKTGVDKGHAVLQPKARVDVVVQDDATEDVIRAIRRCADDGEIGDGKIWVVALEDVIRVRTGEHGDHAA
jgi:nitrogen regulatory protein P-II 1